MADIIFRNVTKKYDDKLVLDKLTLDLPKSGFVCITGPSGAGKTTILNLLSGLQAPDSGEVSVDPSSVISVVFQEDRLLPWENVLDNVLLPCSASKNKDRERDKAIRILSELGLGEELDTYPDELSGGMSRRVSIARALVAEADIYLMDEPTSGLDEDTRKTTLDVIHRYTDGYNDRVADENGRPDKRLLIMITHNPEETQGAYVIPVAAK